jgi:uncharacterized protein YacL
VPKLWSKTIGPKWNKRLPFNEVAELLSRTISAILVWVVAALLIANIYFRSELILLMSIAIVIIAVLIYFTPRLKK